MQLDLPHFDELKQIAQTNPKALEELRHKLSKQLIENAPEKNRRRLEGIQFTIDMKRKAAKTPMAACIDISKMMHETFHELSCKLNQFSHFPNKGIIFEETAPQQVGKVFCLETHLNKPALY